MTEKLYTVELQKKMDRDKWLDSENAGKDLCGSYAYCAYCNKSALRQRLRAHDRGGKGGGRKGCRARCG